MNTEQDLSLGQYLRCEREGKGISIEQVASATRINVRMLHLLEEDKFDELPAKPFVRGFVTSYARFVGIDPQEILMKYRGYLDDRSEDRPIRDIGHKGYAFEKKDGESTKKALWVIMVGCVLLGSLIILVVKPALKHQKQSQEERLQAIHAKLPAQTATENKVAAKPAQTNATSATPASQVTTAAPPTPQKTEPQKPVAAAQVVAQPSAEVASSTEEEITDSEEEAAGEDRLNSGINLKPSEIKHRAVFRAKANVWIRYQSDDRPVMQFMLKEGGVLVLRGAQGLRFQASNARAVHFAYNGRGYVSLKDFKGMVVRQNTPTLIFPVQSAENIGEPFPGKEPLPPTPDPAQPTAQDSN